MGNTATGNVVALDAYARARANLPREQAADALSACRKLALDRIGAALGQMLDRIEDELFELAEAAHDRDQQNTYLDARAQARDKRVAIESKFRAHFVDLFDTKVKGGSAAPGTAPSLELSLVEPEALEESLAVREMARKLGAACEGELFGLRQRMGFLLERPDLGDEANPVSPATVCAALKDACDEIESGFKVRMALLRQLERHAESALNGIYHEINAHLIERQILPDVRVVAVRRPAASAPSPATPAPGTTAPGTTAPGTTAPGAAAQPGDVFAQLAQWLSSAPAAVARNAVLGTPGAMPQSVGTASGGGAAAPQPGAAPASDLVAQLTQMHRDPIATSGGDEHALVNTVRAIKSSPLAASLGNLDAMTIDVVGMLFDYIFEDKHIPASVKAQLARLQLPTLKVALLDKAFFSTASHPARRLLDLLAECAIGIDEAHARDSEVLALVESVVATVLAEFESDLELFAQQAKRVEAFMVERRDAEAALVERSAKVVEERERREAALAAARAEVDVRIEERAWLPATLRTMLAGPWAAAMAQAQLEQGRGPGWQELVTAMDELLWSLEPKIAPEDRRRLVSTLPSMLARIGAGLERGGMSQDERDVFFGALVDCHAGAVKAGLRGMTEFPAAPVVEEPVGGLAREVVPAGEVQLEEIRLRPARGSKALRNVFTRTGIWTNLQRGTWVEFVRPDKARMRARLTWISPNKAVYLFTNPLSRAAALSISPEALAEQMRMGEARMLDDGPLVDRAVGSMMASLRPAA